MSNPDAPVVGDKKVVLIHYTMKSEGGEVLESTNGEEPLAYLHGLGGVIPGLERELAGKKVGDKVNVLLPPKDGYGEREETHPQPIPRDAFPPGMAIEIGMPVPLSTESGETAILWVTEVSEKEVFVDANHPLAGETLGFDVEIIGIRDATADELSHGHAHGPDGHHHH